METLSFGEGNYITSDSERMNLDPFCGKLSSGELYFERVKRLQEAGVPSVNCV